MSAKDDESPHVPNEEELSCDPSDDEYEGGGTRDDRSIGACADASMDMGSPLPGDGCLDFDGITRKVVAVKNALGGDETLMKEINVPEIVVVGVQNVGKSSVLKHIIGRDILPYAEDLCTRCPIEITMEHVEGLHAPTADVSATIKNKGKVHEIKHEDLTLLELKDKIEEVMTTLSKPGSDGYVENIRSTPIKVVYRADDVPNLSVTDLPGLIVTPTAGMNHRTPDKVEALLKQRIENPNAVVVLVIRASGNDVQSQAIWRLMSKPVRKRTIAVLTHLDDPNGQFTNPEKVASILSNKLVPVGCGWVGLSHLNEIPGQDHQRKSEVMLRSTTYGHLCGVPMLRRKMAAELEDIVRKSWSVLHKEIDKKRFEVGRTLANYEPRLTPTFQANVREGVIKNLKADVGLEVDRNFHKDQDIGDSHQDHEASMDSDDDSDAGGGVNPLPVVRSGICRTNPNASEMKSMMRDIKKRVMEETLKVEQKLRDEPEETLFEAMHQCTSGTFGDLNASDALSCGIVYNMLEEFLKDLINKNVRSIHQLLERIVLGVKQVWAKVPSDAFSETEYEAKRLVGAASVHQEEVAYVPDGALRESLNHVMLEFLAEKKKYAIDFMLRQVQAFEIYPPTDNPEYLGHKNNKAALRERVKQEMELKKRGLPEAHPVLPPPLPMNEWAKEICRNLEMKKANGDLKEHEFFLRKSVITSIGQKEVPDAEIEADLWKVVMANRYADNEAKREAFFDKSDCQVKIKKKSGFGSNPYQHLRVKITTGPPELQLHEIASGRQVLSISLNGKGVVVAHEFRNATNQKVNQDSGAPMYKISLTVPGTGIVEIKASGRIDGFPEAYANMYLFHGISYALAGFVCRVPEYAVSDGGTHASIGPPTVAGEYDHKAYEVEEFRQKSLSLWKIANDSFVQTVPRTIAYEFVYLFITELKATLTEAAASGRVAAPDPVDGFLDGIQDPREVLNLQFERLKEAKEVIQRIHKSSGGRP